MLEHAVCALARLPAIQCVFVVLAPGDAYFGHCSWGELDRKVLPLYCGGPTRAASVFNGLMALHDQVEDADWILVHDAARPCLSVLESERLLAELAQDDVGGLLALPVADTIKRADGNGRVAATEPREGLWRALTPQMFRYRLLVHAMHAADLSAVTDESSAIERIGLRPRLVAGSATNIKVTYADDLALAATILHERGESGCE